MVCFLHAELVSDGQRIALIADGDDWEMNTLAKALHHICPLLEKSSPPGALLAPATWAAVTQLATTCSGELGQWVPGPALTQWIIDEFDRRTTPAYAWIKVPEGLTARAYQLDAAAMIASAGKFLLFDEPGLGKSAETILGLNAIRGSGKNIFPVVIVVPSWDIADVWIREIATWAPEWRAPVLWKGTERKALAGTADVYITTYATGRLDADSVAGPLCRLRPVSVIADECVTYDTLIDTPSGRQPICDLRQGDLVLGMDHAAGRSVWTPVLGVARSQLRSVVELEGLRLTPDHPVYVTDAGSLWYANDYGDTDPYLSSLSQDFYSGVVSVESAASRMQSSVYRHPEKARRQTTKNIPRYLRMVRETLQSQVVPLESPTAVLHQELLSEMADVPARICRDSRYTEEPGSGQEERGYRTSVSRYGRLLGIRPQSLQGKQDRNSSESSYGPGSERLAATRRGQRKGTYYPAGDVVRAAGSGLGSGASYPYSAVTWLGVPFELQSGYRERVVEGSNRGAWQGSREERERQGSQKEGSSGVTWMDGNLDLERTDPERSLWNLETGTGNYFANGILVHNCHAAKNPEALQSKAVQRIALHAENFVGLTGTPITRNTGDIFPLLAAMDPPSWPARGRFIKRYVHTSDNGYGETIEGLNPMAEPEFRAVLMGSFRRVAKADVLPQLPPKIYSLRQVEIPPEWRKAYDGMERDMLAELPDGVSELPVMSVLAQLTRLSQLASSAADVVVTEEPDPVTGLLKKHYEVTLKHPSWKADVLTGILAERPGHPVVAFAPSRQLIMLAGETCEKAGYRCGYITGEHSQKERAQAIRDFQAGLLDVILVTTGAGGQGITLTAADTVVFLQRPWSLAESIQCEDRAHRIGSEIHDSIEIIDILAVRSIDSRVREALKGKAHQLSGLLQDLRIVRELLGGLPS